MIRDRRRFEELRGRDELARLQAMTAEESIDIGEDLLRSELMNFVEQSDVRPISLARALLERRQGSSPRR